MFPDLEYPPRIVKRLGEILYPFFAPQFVYGCVFASIFWLTFTMSTNGYTFAFHNSQVHAYTLLWMVLLFGFAYYVRWGEGRFWRVITAMAAMIFVFYGIHDSLWIFGTHINGVQLEGTFIGQVPITFYIEKFSRNFVFGLAAYWFILKKRTYFGALFALTLGVVGLYWIINIFVVNIYIPLLYLVIDFLPILGLVPIGREDKAQEWNQLE